jgi:hypothetical protein
MRDKSLRTMAAEHVSLLDRSHAGLLCICPAEVRSTEALPRKAGLRQLNEPLERRCGSTAVKGAPAKSRQRFIGQPLCLVLLRSDWAPLLEAILTCIAARALSLGRRKICCVFGALGFFI